MLSVSSRATVPACRTGHLVSKAAVPRRVPFGKLPSRARCNVAVASDSFSASDDDEQPFATQEDTSTLEAVVKFMYEQKMPAADLMAAIRSLRAADLSRLQLKLVKTKAQLAAEKGRLELELAAKKGRLELELAEKKGELDVTVLKLENVTTELLRVQGLLHMRGVMEYTQRRMVNPEFDAKNAGSSWGTFIMKTPELSMCATQLGRKDKTAAGKLATDMYTKLSINIHNDLQQLTSAEQVYIGPPLSFDERDFMEALCNHMKIKCKKV